MTYNDYRPANKQDKNYIARCMLLASGGLLKFIWSSPKIKMSAEQLLSLEIAKDNTPISYKNTLAVVVGPNIIGMITAYAGEEFKLIDKANTIITEDKRQCLKPFFEVNLNKTLYIDTLFVEPLFRNFRIGQDLLERKIEEAKISGYSAVTLYVWEANEPALNLYEKLEFKAIKRVHANYHPKFKKGARLLLQKNL
jgi:ribosomal protein S18 acetylase RimI-like enzyme